MNLITMIFGHILLFSCFWGMLFIIAELIDICRKIGKFIKRRIHESNAFD